ncbi:Oxidoreductase [Lachnellula willkommii]|uniref:Oxidoreductase n=1 Tax=Lachnellula willkommii TaxID=215461 RepID=A0A559M9V9_9HELO|nr:Oxidoreductase [Lachnellula willkommii]
MVHLEAVQASNRRIASIFGPGLVAMFVGGTSGVGETTLKQFAKHALRPRVYLVGRSQEAASRIKAECKALNPEGEFIFIKKDTSLLRNVDLVCDEIKSKEKSINLLFLTVGTLQTGIKTEEGLHYAAALVLYCRHRFISNLLLLIQVAPGLRRVVTTFVATMEGTILKDDIQLWNRNLMRYRGHAASVVSLALEKHAKDAPEVSFIHNFPGPVKSRIARGTGGILGSVFRGVYGLFGSLVQMPFADAGDRHVFLATSARYPASGMENQVDGVPIADGDQVAKGTDGRLGSGLYSIDMFGESAKPEVYEVLEKYRKEGMVDWVWQNLEDEFVRVTGKKVG